MARAVLIRRGKWTDERGNLYEVVLSCYRESPEAVDIPTAFVIVWPSSNAAKSRLRFYTTIITRRGIIGTSKNVKNRIDLWMLDSSWQISWLRRAGWREPLNEDRDFLHKAVNRDRRRFCEEL